MSETDVRAAFSNQVAYCNANGAPVTAAVVAAIAKALDPANLFGARVLGWTGKPLADAVPLRCAGGFHALYQAGQLPQLQATYAGRASQAETDAAIATVIRDHEAALLTWLEGPPQTNEAGRSSNFIAAMLWLAGQGLPPRFELLEIGSSAGINLMLDRYHYDLGGVQVGPDQAVMRFAPEWRGAPPPSARIEIALAKGCDVAPVDLTDSDQAARLRAYIWPEHQQRFERLEAAIAAARQSPPNLVAADAADFVEAELARPQAPGVTRVLMHSIVWQYVPEASQQRVTAAMEAAATGATPDRPLAWIALEANRDYFRHELVVRHWPGEGAPQLLATAHAHGAWIEWV